MKLVQINATCDVGSTGKICVAVSRLLVEAGVENYILYSSGHSDYPLGIKYQDDRYTKLMAIKSRILGNYGFNSKISTLKLIHELERIQPDVIHLHNLHTHNCDLKTLFVYFRKKGIKLFWTFHDCWSFTGYCTYFTLAHCEKWQTGCYRCAQYRDRCSWFFDRSRALFQRKKSLFSNLDLTIIAPSQWLTDLVKQSFLQDYPIRVIHNGIDLSVFKPTESKFREKHNILPSKKILLGVAFDWGIRKGLDVFVELAKRLDACKYQIVLVGTDESVDKKLSSNIMSIHRTQNQSELVEIYSAADLFVNPTREENYPTVNMEAIACGTPVLTFRTGGSPEILDDTCGSIVDLDDIDGMEKEIIRICEQAPYDVEACLQRAKLFDMNQRFKEYIELYECQDY